ncbi:radical SAM/SPASM domain-containing protein [Proteiniphilum saccharofermentans]|uniref:radical SAM/SPASM domain-containing protein n=2 Tax=Proteiniphilum TaxID=294702 RepID=UPI0028A6E531|nr:radical SAM protein [Proteiniphilum saccharofermentans]
MKKNFYLFQEEISPQIYLHYNSFSNEFLLLNKTKHEIFNNYNCEDIEKFDNSLYNKLLENYFIVPDDFDEFEVVKNLKRQMQYNSNMYQIMINTTLDCNLNCWYCYENRISKSYLNEDTIKAIKKNIEYEYQSARYNTLKVSFFGGEPLLYFEGVKKILDYAKEFCDNKEIALTTEFTTNATLINEEKVDYLKSFNSSFQITLDGDRKVHNSIKKDILNPSTDTYQKTIEALRLINSKIPNRGVAVRVNFDNRALRKIDEIINDIDFMDRKSTFVILKKVWQIPTNKVDRELLHSAIQKFFDKKFLLDYYIMPKGYLCFAERQRHTLFNYDGKVFKCSTVSSFDEKESLGKLNFETGQIKWDLTKMANWFKDITQKECEECKWFPACFGPCNKQLLAHTGKFICTFDSMNMDSKEYLMYSFKYHLLKEELNQVAHQI